MQYPLKPIDANGQALEKGDTIILNKAPEPLLQDLPLEDQNAIKAQEGKPMEVMGFDKYGHVELEFTSTAGSIHTIWVEPKELFKVDN